MARSRILMRIGFLVLLSLLLQGCNIFCFINAIFGGDPRACLIGSVRTSVTCGQAPNEPGTSYAVPIGADRDVSNPCESAPGVTSHGRFAPGDSFTLDAPPDGLSLNMTVQPGGVPSFTLHAAGSVDQLVRYTYSTASGDIGIGSLLVRTASDADLAVSITGSSNPAGVFDPLIYTIRVTNNGPNPAVGVVLTETLGSLFSEVPPDTSASQGHCTASRQGATTTITCDLGALASGGTATLTTTVTPFTTGTITNTATVKASTSDVNGLNNTAAAMTVVAGPDLSVGIVASPDPANVGGTLTYDITVTNHGPGSARGIVVTDALPTGATFVSATAGCLRSGGSISCPVGTLASGASRTVTITVTPSVAGTLTTTVNVLASPPDPNPANNTAMTTTTVREVVTGPTTMVFPVPACLVAPEGSKPGCEDWVTLGDGCRAGDFTFRGSATRRCTVPINCCGADCPGAGRTLGDAVCAYTWNVDIAYQPADPSIPASAAINTKADPPGVTVTPTQLSLSTRFTFDVQDQSSVPPVTYSSSLRVCSCGPITYDLSCDEGRSPVSGAFIIQSLGIGSLPGSTVPAGACARSVVNGCNLMTVDNDCTCPGGATAVCP